MTSKSSSVDWDVFKARRLITEFRFIHRERRSKINQHFSLFLSYYSAGSDSSHQLGWTSSSEEGRLGEDWVLGFGQSKPQRYVDAQEQHSAEWWDWRANWTLIEIPNRVLFLPQCRRGEASFTDPIHRGYGPPQGRSVYLHGKQRRGQTSFEPSCPARAVWVQMDFFKNDFDVQCGFESPSMRERKSWTFLLRSSH